MDRQTDGQTDGPTDGLTDGPTKRGVESRSARLKTGLWQPHKAKELLDKNDDFTSHFGTSLNKFKPTIRKSIFKQKNIKINRPKLIYE